MSVIKLLCAQKKKITVLLCERLPDSPASGAAASVMSLVRTPAGELSTATHIGLWQLEQTDKINTNYNLWNWQEK